MSRQLKNSTAGITSKKKKKKLQSFSQRYMRVVISVPSAFSDFHFVGQNFFKDFPYILIHLAWNYHNNIIKPANVR